MTDSLKDVKGVVSVTGCISGTDLIVGDTHFVATRIFFNRDAAPDADVGEPDITLGNLWKIKQCPSRYECNCFVDSVDLIINELQLVKGTVLVVDTAVGGRNLVELIALASRVSSDVHIACCSGPVPFPGATTDSMADQIASELLLGISVRHIVESKSIKPCAISYALSHPNEISLEEFICLESCAIAQKKVPGVPIIIDMPPWSQLHRHVVDTLHRCGADVSRVMFRGSVVSSATVDYFSAFLSETICPERSHQLCLCIDRFGATELPLNAPSFPTDADTFGAVQKLVSLGFTDRIILSPGIHFRIDFRAYGGPGYSHVQDLCNTCDFPFSSSIMSTADIKWLAAKKMMTSSNGIIRLAWFETPPSVPTVIEKWTCLICGGEFVPGNHYEKFGYIYCSSSCLDIHRKINWKT